MHALLEAPEESRWLQWGGSRVWREIGACAQERWRSKNKKKKPTRENIILCRFSLSSDTQTHSQGEAKVLLVSFVPACSWGAFRRPLRLAWRPTWAAGLLRQCSEGYGIPATERGDVAQILVSLGFALLRVSSWSWGKGKCFRLSTDQQLSSSAGWRGRGAVENATGTVAMKEDTGTSIGSKWQPRSLLTLASSGQAEIYWCPLEAALLSYQLKTELQKCVAVQVVHGYSMSSRL